MAAAITRTCSKCGEEKPLTEYYKRADRGTSDNPSYQRQCKKCRLVYIAKWQASPSGRPRKQQYSRNYAATPRAKTLQRAARYRKHYNSSFEAYSLQLTAQAGRCALCDRLPVAGEKHFSFDHDHVTGETRGVLCFSCNTGLGCFKDDPDLLRKALSYLRRWGWLGKEGAG